MKIAFIGTRGIPARYGGIEASLEETALRLAQKGHKIVIYCRTSAGKTGAGYLPENIELVDIQTLNTKHLGTLTHTFLSAVHCMFSDAEIAHFHALGPSLFSFLPRLAGKKTIVTVHGLDWKRKKWKLPARLFLKLCEYPAVFFPDRTIAVSRALKGYFENKFKRKVYFIPNGINLLCDPAKEGQGVPRPGAGRPGCILFVGRLVPEKGIHYLIKSFRELKTERKLIIAGALNFADKYTASLRRQAGKNTEFLGFVRPEELRRLYKEAYVFVLPSEIEGSPVSLLEAMGYGKCALVSDIPECLEIIGDCGLSFKSADYLDLKDKLQYLIDNPDVAARMGARGKERAGKLYTWDRAVNELESLYLSLR
jgi:glycosyltransferase involved in cell wall biosynthesis